MSHTSKLDIQYLHDAEVIKNAILSAQYEATRGANNIQLMLYYSIGRFISQNTRKGRWGTGAIASISRLLKQDLPGLRGFSEANLKKMRTFYEEWSELDVEIPESNSLIQTSELGRRSQTPKNQSVINSLIQTNEIQILPFNFPAVDAFPGNDFRSIGFTHHTNILIGTKNCQERIFYISLCAREHLTPDGIMNCIKQNLFAQKGSLPNNFLQRLTAAVYAMRQLGYIRRKCGDKDMRQWLSEHLKIDYTEHKNASQFRRAMNEHGRYTPEVQDEVFALESMGYFRFQPPVDPDKSGCTSN